MIGKDVESSLADTLDTLADSDQPPPTTPNNTASTDIFDDQIENPDSDSYMNTNSFEPSSRVMVEKTELEPILEGEVLEIDPTPYAADEQGSPTSPMTHELEPVTEENEPEDDEEDMVAETASLRSQNADDAHSIAASNLFLRKFSHAQSEFVNRLKGSRITVNRNIVDEVEDEFSPNLPYKGAPNGGYGWIITLVSFVSFMVVDGTFFCFGVFFPEFVKHFDEDASLVSWVGSVCSGCAYLIGPLASVTVDRFGLRVTALSGCVLGTVAIGLSIIAPSVYVLIFTWGVLYGAACTFATVPLFFSLSLWFDTKRGLASGLGVSGGGVGSVLFPPLMQYVCTHYNWQLAAFLMSVAFFLMLFALMFIKPVPSIRLADSRMSLNDIEDVDENDKNVFHNPGRMRLKAFRKAVYSINSTANNSLWRLSQENVTGGQTSINDVNSIGRSQYSISTNHNQNGSIMLDTSESARKLSSYATFMQHFLRNQQKRPSAHYTDASSINGGSQQEMDQVLEGSNEESDQTTQANSVQSATPRPEVPGAPRPEVLVTPRPELPGTPRREVPGTPRIVAANGVHSEDKTADKDKEKETSPVDKKMVPPRRPLRRMDIFYSGSTINLERAPQSIINLNRSHFSEQKPVLVQLPGMVADDKESSRKSRSGHATPSAASSKVAINTLIQLLNVKLMEQISFSMFVAVYFVFMLGYFIPYVHLPALVLSSVEDVSPEQAGYFIPLIGLTNTLGRLVMGIVGGMGMLDPCYLNAVSFLACGVSTLIVPLFSSLSAYLIYALVFGFFCAANVCVRSLALVSLVGVENLTSGFGIILFTQGVGALLGLPLASFIGNMFGSTSAFFHAAGVAFLIAGLMCLPLKPISVWEIRRFQREQALAELDSDEIKEKGSCSSSDEDDRCSDADGDASETIKCGKSIRSIRSKRSCGGDSTVSVNRKISINKEVEIMDAANERTFSRLPSQDEDDLEQIPEE